MALINNLTNYWKLDESSGNASDSLGGATLTNANTTYSAVKINNGAVFNGSNAQLSGTITGDSAFSVSMWLNATTLANDKYFWTVRNVGNSANYGASITAVSGSTYKIRLVSYDGATALNIDSGVLNEDTLYHVVFLINGASSAIYVNAVSSVTGTIGTFTSGTNFYLGANAATGYVTGQIDEVGIWNDILTGTEITQLYNGGAGLSYDEFSIKFTIAETLSLSETSTNLRGLVSDISETLSLSETITALKGISFTIADSLGLIETYEYLHNKVFTISDSLGIVEVLAEVRKRWKNITKSVTSWSNSNKSSSPTWSEDTKSSTTWTESDKS